MSFTMSKRRRWAERLDENQQSLEVFLEKQ
jgi:hypothetical protein